MKKILESILLATLATSAFAAPQTFDFKDPKGVNNAVFKTDAPLESINGTATGVEGKVIFDPENPSATTGKIVVKAESLNVPNSTMRGHLHSPMWLDVAKYPDITFDIKKLENVKTTENATSANAVGTFTLHGVSKDMTIPVKLTYLKDKLGARVPGMKGDLLVVRATFDLKRSDFGIDPKGVAEKVSEDIALSLSIAGAAAK